MESLGVLNLKRNKPLAARGWFTDARVLFAEVGWARGVVMTDRRLGESYRDTRNYDQADKHLRSALDWFREQDDDYMVLRTGRSLVLCLIEQRRVQEAQELLIESLVLARKLGATTDAQELSRLGEALRAER